MKRKIMIIITLGLATILFSCSSNPDSTLNHPPKRKVQNFITKEVNEGLKDIIIFSTNDSFSSYNKNLGYSKIKYYYDHIDRNENYTVLVDIGNFSTGNEVAEKSNGKSSVEIINEMKYDLVVPGSHEFDYGLEAFFENMNALGDKVVCCNMLDTASEQLIFPPYKIFKYGDLKIAFIGVTSPEAIYMKNNRHHFFDKETGNQLIYFFEDEDGSMLYNQIQACVDSAIEKGADKVVLLSHLGIENVTTRWSSMAIIANTKNIDAVVDGHSMEVNDNGLMLNKIGTFVPIVQAGSHLKYLGAMNITKDGYIYPAVLKDRSINKADDSFQEVIDKIIEKYS